MNKTLSILVAIVLTALIVGGATFLWQKGETNSLRKEIESLQEDVKPEEATDSEVETTTPETSSGLKTYESDSLGLSFSYPSTTNGNTVTVEEALNSDQNGEIGSVSLLSGNSRIASISVEWIDSPTLTDNATDHLEAILLKNSETCNIELIKEGTNKDIYAFKTSASPYGDEFDPNCQILSVIYVFDAQPNKVAIVGTGQAPPFSAKETEAFFDSIKLFQ